jgi:aryl-alcohol dehydrogenase-like predicted oxidoreductase
MKNTPLPRTSLSVSSLCLGTAEFGAGVSEDLSFRLLDQFVEAGGNFLDTAAIYADWTPVGKGSSERLIRKWLTSRGNRDKMVLATKGGHPELKTMMFPRLKRVNVHADLNDSLRNFGVETIDLYYLHRDNPRQPVEEILEYMEGFVHAGKIRYYACSNWGLERMEEARVAAEENGWRGFVANQPKWSLAQPDMSKTDPSLVAMDEATQRWHETHGVSAIPYSSQANGFFNKVTEETEVSAGQRALYGNEVNARRFEALQSVREATGLSVTQVVLGYLLSQPFPVVPVIGCKTEAHLTDSLSAADVKLEPEQVAALSQR